MSLILTVIKTYQHPPHGYCVSADNILTASPLKLNTHLLW